MKKALCIGLGILCLGLVIVMLNNPHCLDGVFESLSYRGGPIFGIEK